MFPSRPKSARDVILCGLLTPNTVRQPRDGFVRWNQRCRRHRFRLHLLRSKGGAGVGSWVWGFCSAEPPAKRSLSHSRSLSVTDGSSKPQMREEKKFAGLTKSFLTDDLCPGKQPARDRIWVAWLSQTLPTAGLRCRAVRMD